MLTETIAAAERLLVERGAASLAHPGGTLLEHLHRVLELLRNWDANPEVQIAGFCHALYGTDGFDTALLSLAERPKVVEVIGPGPEALVYLYASCDRSSVYPRLGSAEVEFRDRFTGRTFRPDHAALHAFVEITAANELDVVTHNPDIADKYGASLRRLFTRAAGHLSPAAAQAWA